MSNLDDAVVVYQGIAPPTQQCRFETPTEYDEQPSSAKLVAFVAKGRYILVGGTNGKAFVYDMRSKQLVQILQHDPGEYLACYSILLALPLTTFNLDLEVQVVAVSTKRDINQIYIESPEDAFYGWPPLHCKCRRKWKACISVGLFASKGQKPAAFISFPFRPFVRDCRPLLQILRNISSFHRLGFLFNLIAC